MSKGRSSGAVTAKGGKRAQQQQKNRRRQRGPIQFAKAVRTELKKVNWPDRDQLRQSTAVVLMIVATLGVYVAAWDFIFQSLARLIFA